MDQEIAGGRYELGLTRRSGLKEDEPRLQGVPSPSTAARVQRGPVLGFQGLGRLLKH